MILHKYANDASESSLGTTVNTGGLAVNILFNRSTAGDILSIGTSAWFLDANSFDSSNVKWLPR